MTRSTIRHSVALALLLAVASAFAGKGDHVAAWSKEEAERFIGTRVRAQKNLLSWGPVLLRDGTDEGVQPKPIGRDVITGAEGKIIAVGRDATGNYSVIVEWGVPVLDDTYQKPAVWRSWIDRSHYVSAVVEISRPEPPIVPVAKSRRR